MSDLFRLSQAMAKGRTVWPHQTREEILVALLRQRAEAFRHGLVDQEAMLRNQIIWSLPVKHLEDEAAMAPESETAVPAPDA